MRPRIPFAVVLVLALVATSTFATGSQRDWSQVEMQIEQVREGIYVIMGPGGNIGLSTGADGAFLVDDQFAPLTDAIRTAIATVTDAEVRFVLNTHWHGDHTGGNENFGEVGAMIVAHENVRRRMNPAEFGEVMGSTEQAPAGALPVVTFTDSVTFYWNDERLQVQHVEHAHTDGDALVWFRDANVVHMGDLFFRGMFPFIDVDSGGNVNGVLAAAERVLAEADENTLIIPGHGAVGTAEDLREFHTMVVTIRDRIQTMIDEGRTLEEIVAAAPTADYDEGMQMGFMYPERMVTLIFRSLTGE